MENVWTIIWAVIKVLLIAILMSLVLTWPEMLLWNWLAPLFKLPLLTFWQMFGLDVLFALVFRSNATLSK